MSDGKVIVDVVLDSQDAERSVERLSSKLEGVWQDKNGRWRDARGRFVSLRNASDSLGHSVGDLKNKATTGVGSLNKSLRNTESVGRRAAFGIKELVVSLGLVSLASKAINMVTRSLDGAIDRYDTLNNFPRVLQQIGFDAESSEKAIKRLSDGIQGLPTTLDNVAGTAQRIAVLTQDLDGAVETTLALNNAFISSGASSMDAARGLEQYVQMLSKGEVDLQSWRTLQETMGVALNDVAKAFGFAGASAQTDLYIALRDGIITFDQFNDKIIELSNATGGFAERALTASGGIKTAWTNVRTAVVRGVADVISKIDEVAGGTGSIESGINRLKDGVNLFFGFVTRNIPVVVQWFKNVKTALEPWIPIITRIIAVIGAMIGAFSAVNSVRNALMAIRGAILAVNAAMLANPIGLIIALIAGLVAGLVFAYKNVEWFRDMVNDAWTKIKEYSVMAFEGIKQIISTVIPIIVSFVKDRLEDLRAFWAEHGETILAKAQEVFQKIWSTITTVVGDIVGTIKHNLEVIRAFWNENGEQIIAIVKVYFDAVWSHIKFVLGLIKGLFETVWPIISGIVKIAWNLIQTLVKVGINGVLGAIQFVLKILKGDWKGAWETIKNTFITNWRHIQDFFRKIDLKTIGQNIIRGLINGLGSMLGAVKNKVRDIGNAIANGFKSFFGIKSPSRLMREQIGKYIPAGIAEGIEKNDKTALKSVKNLAKSLTDQTKVELGVQNRLRDVKTPLDGIILSEIQFGQTAKETKGSNNAYDDSEIKALLKQLVEKNPDIYMDKEKVGSIIDGEQAKRINLLGRRVALE